MDFRAFGKISRLSRDIIITEKIDGTNGLIAFDEQLNMSVGSRKRWLSEEDDNFGFYKWAKEHEEDLKSLGVGFHYGEWWGLGIQRRYDMTEKRFSLFNVGRWGEGGKDYYNRPPCCYAVPILYRGIFDTHQIEIVMEALRGNSVAKPGFPHPEGIVVFHTASGNLYKKTFEKDEVEKDE